MGGEIIDGKVREVITGKVIESPLQIAIQVFSAVHVGDVNRHRCALYSRRFIDKYHSLREGF